MRKAVLLSWAIIRRMNSSLAAFIAVTAIFLAAMLAGCGPSDNQQTATAVYAQAQADIERLRATATILRARMKTTLEHAGTRVGQAEDAAGLLRFSLISLGTDADFVETSVSQIERMPTAHAEATRAATRQQAIGAIRPVARPTVSPAATDRPVASPQPIVDSSQPRLEDIVMASGVDNADCAIDANPLFTPASQAIYVVAEAYNIAAGAKISSRWYRRGAEVAYFSFEAENAINGNCIWFYIDQTDTVFVPGAWNVEVLLDDVNISGAIVFQVIDS